MFVALILLCLSGTCHPAGDLLKGTWVTEPEECMATLDENRKRLNQLAAYASKNRKAKVTWEAECINVGRPA